MKTLIAYFSRADENYFGGSYRYVEVGNTQICAGLLQQMTGADVFRIEMAEGYSPVYKECVAQAVAHFRSSARPALKAVPDSVGEYDVMILGYPNYCGTVPMAVMTFLEQFDWTGKKILPLCTNEGSGMGKSEQAIRSACPGAVIAPGLSVNGSAAAEAGPAMKAWLEENNIL